MKNKMLCVVGMFCIISLNAQTLNPIEVPTPNAASLGKFGDIPVSYHTGSPGISIPLYTLSVRGVDMPISLDYDASGVQMNCLPSWTGHNWTLQAGGIITRHVEGRYDEYKYPTQMTRLFGYDPENYFEHSSRLTELLEDETDGYSRLKNQLVYNYYDLSPDIFSFSFMGKTGKFFMDHTGNWVVCSDENLDVLFDPNDNSNFIYPFISKYPDKNAIDKCQPKVIKGFKIRDAQGTTYEFGGNVDAIDFSTSFFRMGDSEQKDSWIANSWYLTKVTDKYGNVLYDLTYKRGFYVIQAFNNYFQHEIEESGSFGFFGVYGGYTNIADGRFPYEITIHSPVYLKDIVTSNGINVNFRSTINPITTEDTYRSMCLDGAINLYSKLTNIAHNYTSYSQFPFYYLQADEEGLAQYRYTPENDNKYDLFSHARLLKLDNINICDSSQHTPGICYRLYYNYKSRMHLEAISIQDGSFHYTDQTGMQGRYSFKYNHFDRLPSDYLTTSYDHWGYYNGKNVPAVLTSNYDEYKVYRDPDASKCQYGVLTKIIYPTGGCSTLEYECNTFSKCISLDRQHVNDSTGIAGGLRIKKITEYEDSTCAVKLGQRSFKYTMPDSDISSGVLYASPCYYWKNWRANTIGSGASSSLTTFSTSSIVPTANSFGSHIGYSYVTETEADGSKKLYHYSNFSDCLDDKYILHFGYDTPSPFDKFGSRDYQRGKLLDVVSYNKNGLKTQSQKFTYRSDNVESEYVLTSNLSSTMSNNSVSFDYYPGCVYKLFFLKYDLVSLTDSVFTSNNGTVITTHSYEWNDYTYHVTSGFNHLFKARLMSSETVLRHAGTGNTIQYQYTYADDNTGTPESNLYNKMFVLQPIKVTCLKGGKMAYERYTTYKNYEINGTNRSVPDTDKENFAGGTTHDLLTYSTYTPTGALKSYKKAGEPYTYLYWAYNDNYLIAKAQGANTNGIPTITNKEMYDEKKFKEKMLPAIFKNRYLYVTAYSHKPIEGVTSIIQPNGQMMTYEYDKFCRLIGVLDNKNKIVEQYDYNYRLK